MGKKNVFDKNVYLIFGEERYLVLEKEREIAAAFAPPAGSELMNISVYKDGVPAAELKADCEMLPFMAEKRLVRVSDSGLFDRGKKDDTEAVTEYIKDIPETTVLVFVEKKVDKRNVLYKAVKKYGECLEFAPLKAYQLTGFVKERSKGMIKDADYFISYVGESMEKLDGEINKLLTYTNGGAVTNDIINEVCSPSLDTFVFNMTAAIGGRDMTTALDMYGNMLRAKEQPTVILGAIERQLVRILQCRELERKGKSREDIAQTVGVKEYAVRKYLEQARNFKLSELLRGIKACYKCDLDIKTGKISDALGVELVILGMSR